MGCEFNSTLLVLGQFENLFSKVRYNYLSATPAGVSDGGGRGL